jgi:hypothetical protein
MKFVNGEYKNVRNFANLYDKASPKIITSFHERQRIGNNRKLPPLEKESSSERPQLLATKMITRGNEGLIEINIKNEKTCIEELKQEEEEDSLEQ